MSVSDLFGIRLPLIQAPMAGVQDYRLAAAVSNAGGLGSLPCAMLSVAQLRDQLAALRQATAHPINLNFFAHRPQVCSDAQRRHWESLLAPYYREFGIDARAIRQGGGRAPFSSAMADCIEPFRPDVVSFHFGLPSADLLARVQAWGSRIISTATTLDEALWLEQQGVDAIIAQGLEAGGHRGIFLTRDMTTQMTTQRLLSRIVGQVAVPVIAAGGIADADAVAGAMQQGAAGVQVGTAYLLSDEATTSPVHRRALKDPSASHTALTNLFSGGPARGIMNRVMHELGPMSAAAPPFPSATAAMAPLRTAAEQQGRGDFSPLWSGQNNAGCAELPAAEITASLVREIF